MSNRLRLLVKNSYGIQTYKHKILSLDDLFPIQLAGPQGGGNPWATLGRVQTPRLRSRGRSTYWDSCAMCIPLSLGLCNLSRLLMGRPGVRLGTGLCVVPPQPERTPDHQGQKATASNVGETPSRVSWWTGTPSAGGRGGSGGRAAGRRG